MPRKFWEIVMNLARVGFVCSSEKDRYFLKILKQQHKFVQGNKRGKLVFVIFQINDAKTCLYQLKISDNIEIEHFFQSKAFFHLIFPTQVASAPLIVGSVIFLF